MIISPESKRRFQESLNKSPNPFEVTGITSKTEIWTSAGKLHVDSINRSTVEAALDLISRVRVRELEKASIAIVGSRGRGKSYIIKRIWNNLEADKLALLSYISPCNHSLVQYHVRFQLCEDLNRSDSSNITQWQKLATNLIHKLQGSEHESLYQEEINLCYDPHKLAAHIKIKINKAKYVEFFDDLSESIADLYPDVDLDFLKACLFMLFRGTKISQIALAWLRGDDHPSVKTAGLPEYTQEQERVRDIWVVKQLGYLTKIIGQPIILCFDQVEDWQPDQEQGYTSPQRVATCIDQLYLECDNVIFLTGLLPESLREIDKLRAGMKDRVLQRVLQLSAPDLNQLKELTDKYLHKFLCDHGLNPSQYPYLYPFSEKDIYAQAKLSLSLRDFIKWCKGEIEKYKDPEKPVTTPPNLNHSAQIFKIYEDLLKQYDKRASRNDADVAQILFTCFQKVLNNSINGVDIKEVHQANGFSSNDLHFVVTVYDSHKRSNVRIGVRVCETQNGNTFSNTVKRLLKYEAHNLSRGCLIRSTPLPGGWSKGRQLMDQLVNQHSGEVIISDKSKMAWYQTALSELWAISQLITQRKDYQITDPQLEQFLKDNQILLKNGLIDEILSAPE